jgi:hypothetical protein
LKRFNEVMGLLAAVFICTSCVFLFQQSSVFAQACGDCPNGDPPCTSAAICEGKAVGVPFKYAGFDVWCHDLNRVCPIGIDCCGVSFGKKGTVSFDPPRTIPDGDPGGISAFPTN